MFFVFDRFPLLKIFSNLYLRFGFCLIDSLEVISRETLPIKKPVMIPIVPNIGK